MKFIIKLFMAFATMVFVLATAIKIVQGCSYKEAAGILEEFWNEIMESCCRCSGADLEEKSSEEA